jgi:hypothetical protein
MGSVGLMLLGSAMTDVSRDDHEPELRYLPLVSTFCFSSSFIFFTTGSRLASPVVWVVVAGGLWFGMEVCPGGVVAGRVAVALGGDVVWAVAVCAFHRSTLDSSDTASAVALGFIGLNSSQTNETAGSI